jgi:maltose O-acetyltransferase
MNEATEKEKMLAGKLYRASDETLTRERMRARKCCQDFNSAAWDDHPARQEILSRLLGTCHPDTFIEPSFKCDYGYNIHVGEGFQANFDLVVLDVCEVRIGRDCLIGPRVCIYTATHPLDAETRASGLELGSPVRIGDRVWIGGNAVINPGVTLGDDTVVAAGAVVTRSFGNKVLIGGVPARVLKTLE